MNAGPNAIKPSSGHLKLVESLAPPSLSSPENALAGKVAELHDSLMEERIRATEIAIAGIKPTLDNIGSLLGRWDTTLSRLDQRMLAVEVGQAGLTEKVASVATRVAGVESAVNGAVKDAISRVPSWWQVPVSITGTIVGVGASLTALAAAATWLRLHGWLMF